MEKISTFMCVLWIFIFIQKNHASIKCPTLCQCEKFIPNGTAVEQKVNCSGQQLIGIPKLGNFHVIMFDISFNNLTDFGFHNRSNSIFVLNNVTDIESNSNTDFDLKNNTKNKIDIDSNNKTDFGFKNYTKNKTDTNSKNNTDFVFNNKVHIGFNNTTDTASNNKNTDFSFNSSTDIDFNNKTDIVSNNNTDFSFNNTTDIGSNNNNNTDFGYNSKTDFVSDNNNTDFNLNNKTDIGSNNYNTDFGFNNKTDFDFNNNNHNTDFGFNNNNTGIVFNNVTDSDSSIYAHFGYNYIMDIDSNIITDNRDTQFSFWGKNLKYFYLNQNGIKKIEIEMFKPFSNLLHINLAYNYITTIDSKAFERNHRLWKLILNGNPIGLHDNYAFLNIPSLGWLEMDNCNITRLPANVFHNLKRLIFIKLRHNKITHIEPKLFWDMQRLRHVHLEDNDIAQLDPNTFINNRKLQWLYIAHNPIHNISHPHFVNISSLLMLDISFCNLNNASIMAFSNLHNLKNLKLANNNLEYFEIPNFPKNLEILDLSGNRLTNLNLSSISKEYRLNLKYLDLTGNNLICDCDIINIWKLCAYQSESNCDYQSLCPGFVFSNCSNYTLQKQKVLQISFSDNDTVLNNMVGNSDINNNEQTDYNDNVYEMDFTSETEESKVNITKHMKIPEDSHEGNSKWMWNIVLYSIIGFLGVLCVLGAAVLAVEMFIGLRRSHSKSSSNSDRTLKQIQLQAMGDNTDEERHELRPHSSYQGFDVVSLPANDLPEIVPRRNIRRPSKR